jgi:hypothetical protein
MVMLRREALDPEIREAVRDLPDFVFSAETVPMMRQNAVFTPVTAPDIERTELTTEPDGGVSMTVLRPRDAVGNLPVLYWMHGGGMVIGNRYMDDARLGAWCRLLSCVCVSVEYRLAPEAPYPAPIDDCDQGLRYIVDHAAELRLDPHRIGVGGRSAGGGLAAALALRWRDRGDDHVAFQYLEYPMLDDRMNTPSASWMDFPCGVANPTLSAGAPISATTTGPTICRRTRHRPGRSSWLDYHRHSSRWAPPTACATRRSTSPRGCAAPVSRPSFISTPARCTASICSPTVRSSGARRVTAPTGWPASSADHPR